MVQLMKAIQVNTYTNNSLSNLQIHFNEKYKQFYVFLMYI